MGRDQKIHEVRRVAAHASEKEEKVKLDPSKRRPKTTSEEGLDGRIQTGDTVRDVHERERESVLSFFLVSLHEQCHQPDCISTLLFYQGMSLSLHFEERSPS